VTGRVYLRISVKSRPAVLGEITAALGAAAVGIETVVQRQHDGSDNASIIILTQTTNQAALSTAIEQIAGLADVTEAPRVIRIEEEV
jgi:homoserine dehydrogenase